MATYYVNDASGLYQYCNGLYGGPRAVAGDVIVLNSSFSLLVNNTHLQPNPGISIIPNGDSKTITISTVSVNPFQLVGSGTSDWYNNPIVLSGITLQVLAAGSPTSPIGAQGWVSAKGLKLTLRDFDVQTTTAIVSSRRAAIYAEASSGVPVYIDAYNCNFGIVGSSVIVTNVIGNGGAAGQQSYIKLYDCNVAGPGKAQSYTATANDVNLKSAGGFPIYMYGGSIGAGPVSTRNGGAIYTYFTDINTCRTITDTPVFGIIDSVQHPTSHNMFDTYVAYGNNIAISGEMSGNPYDNTTTNRSFNPSIGQSRQRNSLLIKDNNIRWIGNWGTTTHLIENTSNTTSQSGCSINVLNNLITQGTAFNLQSYAVRLWGNPGNTTTAVLGGNTVVGNGNSSTNITFIRLSNNIGISGFPCETTSIYNSFLGIRDLYNVSSANISGVGTSVMNSYWLNNIAWVSGQFLNTSGTAPSTPATAAIKFHKYGNIIALGNVFNFATPENIDAADDQNPINGNYYTVPGIAPYNSFSTNPAISGINALYTIIPNGNVETSAYSPNGASITIDGYKQNISSTSGLTIGSKWRQVWQTGEVTLLPTMIVT